MELTTNLKKIGTSYHVLIPSSLIKVFKLLKYTEDYEYTIVAENDGKRIILNRVKKKVDEAQTKINDFEENKHDN